MAASLESRSLFDMKKLGIDDHAVQRAKERFKRKDRQDALQYCKCLLGEAQYIGETTCEKGNRAHMFVAPNKVAIYLTLDFRVIKTIMKVDDKSYIVYDKVTENNGNKNNIENIFSVVKNIPLQDKLIKLYQTEFKKHDRLEKIMNREFTEYKLTKTIEVSMLRLQAYQTKAKKLKAELEIKIKETEGNITSNELELKRVQDDKRKISRALSTLLMDF